jgi:2-polyprenyl-6-methoxyphenol hydroxylase-like FAD-dependent oxidoreductase
MSPSASNSNNSNKIAIVGAGPSGLALAAILEKQGGFDYVLYESSAENIPPRGGWYVHTYLTTVCRPA